jgi:molybdopterin synthase sulfur carrier subunit
VITVEVALYATLREHVPEAKLGQTVSVTLPKGTTVAQLLEEKLGIPRSEMKIIFVNGVSRKGGYALAAGDRLAVFPPVGGG